MTQVMACPLACPLACPSVAPKCIWEVAVIELRPIAFTITLSWNDCI